MATPTDVGREIERSMLATSKAIGAGISAFVAEAAVAAREEHTQTAVLVPGRDRRFRNFARAGRLSVRVRRFRDAFADGILVIPVGPWGIAQTGAAPHTMKAWGRGKANHPGTRGTQGRRSWTRGEERTIARVDDGFVETVDRHVTEGFNA